MRKLSYWAKTHKWSARIFIVAAFIILNFLGIVTGILLDQLGISAPAILMLMFLCIYFVALIAYPSKNRKGKTFTLKTFYIRQKSFDLILAASTFCMLIYLGNHPEKLFQGYPSLKAAVENTSSLPSDSLKKGYKSLSEFSASMKDKNGNTLKWRERKKLLKEQIKGIKKADELSDGEKILFTILAVLVALLLIYLVAALACTISCSGSDAAAIFVAAGGTALVIFLFVLVMRAIYGRRTKKKQTVEKTAMNN